MILNFEIKYSFAFAFNVNNFSVFVIKDSILGFHFETNVIVFFQRLVTMTASMIMSNLCCTINLINSLVFEKEITKFL